MGKVYSVLIRGVRNFNVEERAHKAISKEKPIPAPKYKSTEEEIKRAATEHPEAFQEQLKKDAGLDVRLKNVYVSSFDTNPEPSIEGKPLPLDRKQVEDFEYGLHEPSIVPLGRCTLRNVLKFMMSHQEDPKAWPPSRIAVEYKLPETTVDNILQNFKLFNIHLPNKQEKEAVKIARRSKENESPISSLNKIKELSETKGYKKR